MKAAYQGAPGAFGHQACLAFLPDHEPEARESFEAVAQALLAGEAEVGVLPVENSRAGPVEGVKELIEAFGLRRLGEHCLKVRMHLLALPGTVLEEVRIVASHKVALRQCSEALAALGAALEEAPNTAIAARELAARAQGERNRAVLASEAAARAYGLHVLKRDMQDDPDNRTRFVVVERPRP